MICTGADDYDFENANEESFALVFCVNGFFFLAALSLSVWLVFVVSSSSGLLRFFSLSVAGTLNVLALSSQVWNMRNSDHTQHVDFDSFLFQFISLYWL